MLNKTDEEYYSQWEGWIETYTGTEFLWSAPEFHLEDIAHSLSMLCRYNGHCDKFYSVAEHSVIVSRLMEENGWDPMEGLMHDAVEAYVGDVPSPLKQYLPDHQHLEDHLEMKIREHYGLAPAKTYECSMCDRASAIMEGRLLMKSKTETWVVMPQEAIDIADRAQTQVQCLTPEYAKQQFLERYGEIQEQAGKD